jgi:hypothetical protein
MRPLVSRSLVVSAVFYLLAVLPVGDLAAQVDPIEAELDAFWAEVSRTVAEGDLEGMRATYHPDAIHVPWDSTSYTIQPISKAGDNLPESTARTRAGLQQPNVEFRFTSRIHDETTAHEVGMVHFWRTLSNGERTDAYGLVDSYLVKKEGRWMILVEIQRWNFTEAEWDALDPSGGDL